MVFFSVLARMVCRGLGVLWVCVPLGFYCRAARRVNKGY